MNLQLRTVTAADQDFLADLYASTRMEELARTDWSDGQKLAFCRQQYEAQRAHYRQHYSNASFGVILLDDVDVGRLITNRSAEEIRIVDISLLPEFRGRGIGSAFLKQLQAEASEAGQSLTIHVERFNPALALYVRLGFRVTDDKGVYLFLKWSQSSTRKWPQKHCPAPRFCPCAYQPRCRWKWSHVGTPCAGTLSA